MGSVSPEAISGVWSRLEAMANQIGDAETRAHYLSAWRERYDAEFPRWLHDSEIVTLPDWKHVGEISGKERRQAEMVSAAWLVNAPVVPEDSDAAKRFAWDVGRRVAAGLIAGKNVGLTALEDRLGSQFTAAAVKRAFERGCADTAAGEGLIAAIVLDLRCELPGIFARLIEGALDWLAHGFLEPDDVTEWTEEYKDENDPLGRFLAYCTDPDAAERIQSSHFHELFCAWSKATGGPDWTPGFLKKKMNGKGFSSKKSNGIQWLGIRATKQVADFIDNEGKVIDLSGSDAWAGGAASARANAAQGPPAEAGWVPPEFREQPPDASPPADYDDDVPF